MGVTATFNAGAAIVNSVAPKEHGERQVTIMEEDENVEETKDERETGKAQQQIGELSDMVKVASQTHSYSIGAAEGAKHAEEQATSAAADHSRPQQGTDTRRKARGTSG